MFNLTAALNLVVPTQQVTRAVGQINNALNSSTRNAISFADAVALKGKGFAAYAVASAAIVRLSESFSKATRDAIRFDLEMSKIAQTVELSNEKVKQHSASIQEMAVRYGLSGAKIAETIRVLAQAGFSFQEAKKGADALASTTLLASFESIADTTDGLISIMKQFNLTMADSEKVLGLLNVISKKYAVESGDLVEAVRKAGGTFATAGGDLKELLTLFTVVRDTTRESAETIATGFRTIFARLSRPKTIQYFQELGIELADITGKLKSPEQAVLALQQGLDKLGITAGTVKFAEVVEEIGGIRQASRVIPLLTQAKKLAQVSADAGGAISSLNDDISKSQDTLYYKIVRLQQAFSRMVSEVIDTKSFKVLTDVMFSLANSFIDVARSLKDLLPLLLGLGALKVGGALRRNVTASGLRGFFFNKGGPVPGSGNSDTVPAMLTPGEFVIKKSAVEAFGAENLHAINKYAQGGSVKHKFSDVVLNSGTKLNTSEDIVSHATSLLGGLGSVGKHVAQNTRLTVNPNLKTLGNFSAFKGNGLGQVSVKKGIGSDVVNHEFGHAIDLLHGKIRGEGFSSDMDGSFQNVLARAVRPNIAGSLAKALPNKKDPRVREWVKYRLSNNELFAELFAKSPLELQRILSFTGNKEKGIAELQKFIGKNPDLRIFGNLQTKKFASGGAVGTDTVPAMLTPGEFVINRESAKAFGYGKLHKINKYANGGVVQGYADGGTVATAGGAESLNFSSLLEIAIVGPVLLNVFKDISNAGRNLSRSYENSKRDLDALGEEANRLSDRRDNRIQSRSEAFDSVRNLSRNQASSVRQRVFDFQEDLNDYRGRTSRDGVNTSTGQFRPALPPNLAASRTRSVIGLIQAQQQARLLSDVESGRDNLLAVSPNKEDARLRLIDQQRRPVKRFFDRQVGSISSRFGLNTEEGRQSTKNNVRGAALGSIGLAANFAQGNIARNFEIARDNSIQSGDARDAKQFARNAFDERSAASASTGLATAGAGIGALFGPIGAGVGALVGTLAGLATKFEAVQGVLDNIIGLFGGETYAAAKEKEIKAAEAAAKATAEAEKSQTQSSQVIRQINSGLVSSFTQLKVAADRASKIGELGDLVTSLASGSFRGNSLSTGVGRGDRQSIASAGRITGAGQASKNLERVAGARETLDKAIKDRSLGGIDDAQLQKIVAGVAAEAGVATGGNAIRPEDLNAIGEALKNAESEYADALLGAAQATESAFNRYLDAIDSASSAQADLNDSMIQFGQSQRDRGRELQNFRANGSTISDIRNRAFSVGSGAANRANGIAASARLAATGTGIAQLQASGGGNSDFIRRLQGDFSALQIATKSQISLIRQDTQIRQQLIDALKEELELEKSRASAFTDLGAALSGLEGGDAQQRALDTQSEIQSVIRAFQTNGTRGAISAAGSAADQGINVLQYLPTEIAEAIRQSAVVQGTQQLSNLGGGVGADAVSAGRTGFTNRGSQLASQVSTQMTEQSANDAALLKIQEDNVRMLADTAKILESSISAIAGHFTNFGNQLSGIVTSLQNTSISMRMEPTNVVVTLNNAEGLRLVSNQMKQMVMEEVGKQIIAMKQGQI